MKRCNECKKWFVADAMSDDQCLFCAEPWKEHDFPEGIDELPSHFDLLAKMQARHTRTEILLPFAHDPKNYYVEAIIYEDKSRYWHIEGSDARFNSDIEAVSEIIKMADVRRLKILNEEFEKEFGKNGRNS